MVYSWNHSVTSSEVSFQNINFSPPVQTSNHHSSKSLIRRNALESLAIFVEQVDAGISRRTWLRRVRAHGPFISRKIPECWIPVSEVGASRGTVEVLTLVDVCAIAVWGGNIKRKLDKNLTWISFKSNLADTVMAAIGVDAISVLSTAFSTF